jgi:hypothetical protein
LIHSSLHIARIRKIAFELLLFLFATHTAMAQEFSVQSDTNRLRIGEQTTLRLEFKSDNSDWILPEFTDTIGALYVVNSRQWDTTVDANKTVIRREVLVTSFDSGYYAIQPFIAYRDEDTVLTEGLFFEVLTVDTLKETPYDIKAPLDAPKTIWETFLETYMVTVLPLAAIMTLYYLYTLYMKRKGNKEEEEKQVPPEVWIVEEFNAMERSSMWNSEPPKQYYDRLTDALRYFIARKYNYRTTEMVTDEIELILRGVHPFEKRYSEFIHLLRKADRAKFAKGSFSESQMQSDFTAAREMVMEWIELDKPEAGGSDV